MKKYIFFDLGGTLIASRKSMDHALLYAFHKLHLNAQIPKNTASYLGPPPMDSLIDFWGFDRQTAKQVLDAGVEYYQEKGLYESHLYEGVRFMLKRLSEEGIHLFAVSSQMQPMVEKKLEYFQIISYFTDIGGANCDGTQSSKEDIIRTLMCRRGLAQKNAADFLVVGDRWQDAMAADIFSFDFVAARYGYAEPGEFRSVDACRVAETAEDLQKILFGCCGILEKANA